MFSISFLSVLLVSVAVGFLGLVTLLNNVRLYSNRVFATLCGLSGFYGVINYLADHDQAHGLFWVRLTFLVAAFLIFFMYLFVNSFPRRIFAGVWDWTTLLATVVVAIITFMPAFIASIILEPARTEVVPGPLYPFFIVFLVLMLLITYLSVVRALKTSSRVERERTKFVAAGLFLTALFIMVTNLILPLLMKNNNSLAALGSYAILIFVSFSTFAIVRHRLFNIRLVVARSIAYILLLVTLAGLYGGVLIGISQLFFPDRSNGLSQDIITTILAIILAFTFQPLRRFFERVTDRIFYRDRYDSQEVLNNFSSILVSELDLDRILKRSITSISEALHIQFGQIIVFNHDRVYRIEHYGPLPKRLMVAPELEKLKHALLVADELEGGERKTIMDDHSIRVSLTLRTREQFIGYLLLGDKLSGDIYSSQDIDLLEIIGKELAVAILNAKAYAEIQEFNVTLQQRVDHATNRLRVANRHLKELDKAKDEFLSMASHQLRTPLTTIKGYLSMLLEGDAGKLTAAEKEFVEYAFTASERMVNLISDLLNVSRLSAGKFLIQTKPTDMVLMISDEVRQLSSHAAAKNIELIFDPPKEILPLVEIDENKTRQVVMNFIDNAIYYTPAGTVKVVLQQTEHGVKLEVTDSGIGVPEEAKKKLFTKFFRATNAQTVRPDGTGLGLYLARRVVEDQGGTIIFNSTEGKGSTFGFELPLKPVLTDNIAP